MASGGITVSKLLIATSANTAKIAALYNSTIATPNVAGATIPAAPTVPPTVVANSDGSLGVTIPSYPSGVTGANVQIDGVQANSSTLAGTTFASAVFTGGSFHRVTYSYVNVTGESPLSPSVHLTSVQPVITQTDTGTGTEAATTQIVAWIVADRGTGTDTATVTGSGLTTFTVTDFGTGLDNAPTPGPPGVPSQWSGDPTTLVTATTLRLYGRLPNVYRKLDAQQGSSPDNLPLLRYLATLCDQLAALEVLLDRFQNTQDLVNPQTADVAWLPWLAQLVGAELPVPLNNPAAARALIANPASGWQAGTKQAIANAVQPILLGTKYCVVRDHYNGDPWQIEVRTRNSETPAATEGFVWDFAQWGQTTSWGHDAVIDAILQANAKPAGYVLVHTQYEATWDTVTAVFPSWDSTGTKTWDTIQDVQPPT